MTCARSCRGGVPLSTPRKTNCASRLGHLRKAKPVRPRVNPVHRWSIDTPEFWRSMIFSETLSLDHQTLAGRQFHNHLAAFRHEPIGGLFVILKVLPAVIVENDDPSWRDAVEQDLERCGLGAGRIQVQVQKC